MQATNCADAVSGGLVIYSENSNQSNTVIDTNSILPPRTPKFVKNRLDTPLMKEMKFGYITKITHNNNSSIIT